MFDYRVRCLDSEYETEWLPWPIVAGMGCITGTHHDAVSIEFKSNRLSHMLMDFTGIYSSDGRPGAGCNLRVAPRRSTPVFELRNATGADWQTEPRFEVGTVMVGAGFMRKYCEAALPYFVAAEFGEAIEWCDVVAKLVDAEGHPAAVVRNRDGSNRFVTTNPAGGSAEGCFEINNDRDGHRHWHEGYVGRLRAAERACADLVRTYAFKIDAALKADAGLAPHA